MLWFFHLKHSYNPSRSVLLAIHYFTRMCSLRWLAWCMGYHGGLRLARSHSQCTQCRWEPFYDIIYTPMTLSYTYVRTDPQNSSTSLEQLCTAISYIRTWMIKNKLKINDDKTEFLVITKPHLISHVKDFQLKIGDHNIPATDCAKNLRCHIWSNSVYGQANQQRF